MYILLGAAEVSEQEYSDYSFKESGSSEKKFDKSNFIKKRL